MAVTGTIQKKNNKFYAVLNLYDKDGKRKPKWVPTGLSVRGNKKAAESFLAELLTEWNQKTVPYSRMTVADYFKQWLVEMEAEVKPNTYRVYVGNMENHIIPYFQKTGILLQDLTPNDLENYYKSKKEAGSKMRTEGESLSPTTIKHHHQNISKALNDAIRKGLISVNPASAARTPKAKPHHSDFLTPSQLDGLVALFSDTVLEIPVSLCAFYGLRRSEVLGLKWKHVNFEQRSITIAETLQQYTGGNYTDTPKTESSYRTLPMPDNICQMLTRHRERQKLRKETMGDYYQDSDYVCTWEDGKVISPNYLSVKFHKVLDKSSLPNIRFHDLRHSAASNLLSMGFSVVQVAEWLGHESATTTLKFYSHADKSTKRDIANTLEESLKIG